MVVVAFFLVVLLAAHIRSPGKRLACFTQLAN
jgi:hypothetical protein